MMVHHKNTRRQQFLSDQYFASASNFYKSTLSELNINLSAGDVPLERKALLAESGAELAYEYLSLKYTAGFPISELRMQLDEVVIAYEVFQRFLAECEKLSAVSPLGLRLIGDYERCMQLIALCYLLGRRDLLPRIAALEDVGYAGQDAFYENLMSYELEGRFETTQMLHIRPYDNLMNAIFSETDDVAIGAVKEYLKNWYQSFEHVPWHDSHTRVQGGEGDYFGYWAFEAAAVMYLLGANDDAIDHMVYPKDLVMFARQFDGAQNPSKVEQSGARCEGGDPCPRDGWWLTPSQEGSRRHFKQGEIMPKLASDYGVTIWQWDVNRQS